MSDEIHINTTAALFKRRWEDEQSFSLDLANQVDQLKAQNAQLVHQHNALVEEVRRLRGEDDLAGVDPMKIDEPETPPAEVAEMSRAYRKKSK